MFWRWVHIKYKNDYGSLKPMSKSGAKYPMPARVRYVYMVTHMVCVLMVLALTINKMEH